MTDLNLSNVTWGEFLIGDLFYKVKLKNKKINKKKDLSKIKTEEFKIPLVNAKFGNNGIMYYGREKDIDYITMSIDIVSDGAVSTGEVYPQIGKTGVLYNAYLIKYKQNISENILLFLTQSIKSGIKNKYGYEYKATWSKVQNEKIKLPITTDGSIDYEFMDQYIQKVKENYYNKCKEQLDQNMKCKITEISDLNLTQSELKNLMKMYNNEVKWGEFKYDMFFNLIKNKNNITKKSIKKEKGNVPVYSATSENNGIIGYTNRKPTQIASYKNPLIVFGDHTITFNIANKSFCTTDATRILKPKNQLNRNHILFIITAWKKTIKYEGYNRYWTKIKEKNIKLPVTDDGSIDYEFMESFTQAMNKIKSKQYLNHLKTLTYKGD